jgi:NAD(P)H-hydrate repair Nnr-like enzyme with NAD(P)H-hydrate epimerase domain
MAMSVSSATAAEKQILIPGAGTPAVLMEEMGNFVLDVIYREHSEKTRKKEEIV